MKVIIVSTTGFTISEPQELDTPSGLYYYRHGGERVWAKACFHPDKKAEIQELLNRLKLAGDGDSVLSEEVRNILYKELPKLREGMPGYAAPRGAEGYPESTPRAR